MADLTERREVRRVDVSKCSACGQEHMTLPFKRLDKPFIGPGGTEYPWHAFCPTTGHSVYMVVTRDGEWQTAISAGNQTVADVQLAILERLDKLEADMRWLLSTLQGGK